MAAAPFLLVASAVLAQAPPVLVVRGSYAAKAGSPEAESAGAFFDTVAEALELAGVEFGKISDEDVATGKLTGAKVVVFPYTPVWAPGEAEATVAFVKSGGKALVFYTMPAELGAALGMDPGPYTKAEGQASFHEARLVEGALDILGLPTSFVNGSWNIHAGKPMRDDCRVLYQWFDPEGKDTGQAALLLSDSGAYMTHVLSRTDLKAKVRLLLALVAHFIPDLWPQTAQRALGQAWQFDDFASLQELERIAERARALGHANDPEPLLARARDIWDQMHRAVQEERYPEVLDLLGDLRAAASEAYARCQPSKRAEMRAVWIHTAFGVGKWGWERSIRHLKECGFNAILPNMLWGGVAYYNSDVLPVAPEVATRGDQVAECAKWCEHYGVELHVWKVNWNLGSQAPESFVAKLREENRLQKDPTGKEIKWLCPSDDRNFELERASMVELVRKYNIAGIHFDYIRYPGMEGCYCERCRSEFEERLGHKVENWPGEVLNGPYNQQWLQFRRDQIDRLVKAVSEEAHRVKPDIQVSAAVFGYWDSSRDSIGQDWVKWIDEGWLDFVCPMDYIPANESLRQLVTKQVQWVSGRIPLYIGLGEWRLRDVAHLIYQIKMTRELGADGYVLFHYDHSEITDVRMPALRLGLTSMDAFGPHVGPRVDWTLPEGLDGLGPRTYLVGSNIRVQVALAPDAAQRATIELRALDGRALRRLGEARPGETVEVKVPVRHSPTRLAVVARAADGRVIFERRSPILWSLSEAERQEREARNRPPVFDGQGLRVGLYDAGYGSSTILRALECLPGVQAKFVYSLREEMLKPCQVFVLPQPKMPAVLDAEAVQTLRQFAMKGGLVVLTHDAVGFRFCPVLFPEVCAGGTERVEETTWRLATELALSGLKMGETYSHSFYDRILVASGPNGHVVVEDLSGRPIVVQGWLGQGEVCACGIALGLGEGDRDVPLCDAEAGLLRGIILGFKPRAEAQGRRADSGTES